MSSSDGDERLGVREETRRSLGCCTPLARRAAEVAAVLGYRFAFDEVAAMLDVAPTSLLGPLDELVRVGLVVEDGARLAFPDDLVHQAVLDTVPLSARAAVQRQAIEVLVAAGVSPREPARLLARSALPGDQAAGAVLIAAAQAVEGSDAETAAELSRRALELLSDLDDRRASVTVETVRLLHAADRARDATDLARAAMRDSADPGTVADLRSAVAEMEDAAPDLRVEAAQAALASSGLADANRARLSALVVDGHVDAGLTEAARALLPEAMATAARSDDASAGRALGRVQARVAYSEGWYATAAEASPPDRWQIELMMVTDRLDEAARVAADAERAARGRGQAWEARAWLQVRGRCHLQAGALEPAADSLGAAFRAADREPVRTAMDAAVLSALGRVSIHTGDTRGARRLAALARRVELHASPEIRRHAGAWLAWHALATGEVAEAHAHVARLEGEGIGALPRLMVHAPDAVDVVRIAAAVQDDDLARRAVSVAETRLRRNPGVATLAGVVAHARGLWARDVDALEEACEQLDRSPHLLARAAAHEDFGRTLVSGGDRPRAIGELGIALIAYTDAGASWDAARTRRILRDLGVRRRLVKATRPDDGWAGLTAAEVRVARLVAEGLKNREVAERLFISTHTVSMHLRHAFTKLGINTRVALTRCVYAYDEAA